LQLLKKKVCPIFLKIFNKMIRGYCIEPQNKLGSFHRGST